ncbi:methionine/alanine import family NSS transporter small subunit [Agromyces sp. SYSU T0242]|uniref:methionine/alanine import family NSS transporter small subunit n=1 Tax=Agromyces litoreus TaxID=3158561 RepID=UPI003396AFCC
MTGTAIVFLLIAILLVWGGFTVSVLALSRRPERGDYPAGGEDDHREDLGPVERDT